MISNFPSPYPDELIYSVIARYAVHHGILSPKYLTEELFNNRNLTPTYDLPSHLDRLASYLPDQYDAFTLIRKHTLLPIYQLFQPDTVISYAVQTLRGEQYQSLHTKLGKNASRVKSVSFFRFCPHCWQEQIEQYGEVYWKRSWQIIGYDYCTRHQQPLFVSSIPCNGLDRKFYIAHLNALEDSSQLILNSQDLPHHIELAGIIEELLTHATCSPIQDFSILSDAYFIILKDKNLLLSRKNINYKKIRQVILDYWGENFLAYYHLEDLISENCWLKSIFRKHRKAFSYLEHLLVLKALVPEQNPIELYKQYIDLASTEVDKEIPSLCMNKTVARTLSEDQEQWTKLILEMPVKQARKQNSSLYARLYRNYKDWLLFINKSALTPSPSVPRLRVNWEERDRKFVKRLIEIRNELSEDLNSPQQTKKFFIKKLGHVSTIEKNWDTLPLTKAFLDRYSESVSCYQIRRLTKTFIQQKMRQQFSSSSIFLRESGLSPQRLTPEAYRFFDKIMESK
ncbi:TnsD family Tn7-like transposition protein [Acinetobacter schindleri]|uniref:TnsD family Tn7-like transposition protein n=1 Tax=Acinetobacter schindleri TaxID=108981 RepID=UPI0021CD5B5E|nr:TnsD family Tn7-like transposition protein [Acinetobacter schindleri]MCU4323674.1 TnsD family transposase [Acinetobacter schindleri]